MPMTIRRGTAADLAVIVEYNLRLAQESEGKPLDRDILTTGVTAALADPHKGPYFLAVDGDEVLGQMQITYEFSDWRNGWFWWIQGVYVRAESRKRGVFRSLFEHVLALAKQDLSVIGLRLYVENENYAAHQTYARLGMERTGYFVLERFPL